MDGTQPDSQEVTWEFKPGDTVSPQAAQPAQSQQPQQPTPPPVQPQPATPVAPPAPVAAPVPPAAMPQVTPVAQQPAEQPVTPHAQLQPQATWTDAGITWTASEFIAHDKTSGWYGILAIGALVAAVLVWLIFRDVVSSAVIVLAAIMFGVYARRKPRELAYRVDDHGLTIAEKFYGYDLFRSFSLVREGGITGIMFMPNKRFSPAITVYYDPNDEERIVSLLSTYLPLEERKQDPIDQLMFRIRF